MKNNDLEIRLEKLLARYSKNEDLTQSLWGEIEQHYSKPNRAYHNLDHLRSIFKLLDQYQSEIENKDLLEFSIWYHDIIYNAMRKDNEKKSAERAKEVLKTLNFSSSQINQCYDQIMLTKSHQLSDTNSMDEQFLIDFDLEVLSRDWIDYEIYTKQIRKEYWMYPNMLYKKGRRAALESFLNRTQIYYSPHFIKKETQARNNIKREIETSLS